MSIVTADANIYISGLHFRGLPQRFLTLAEQGRFRLAISDAIWAEVHRVLRDKFRWSPEALRDAERRLAAFTLHTSPTQAIQVVISDPDDDRVLERALASGSEFVVTGDHLLDLDSYSGVRIVRVAEFLQVLHLAIG